MRLGVYVINLDRSVERWSIICSRAAEHSIDIIRVSATDGCNLSRKEFRDVDWKGFARHGGRTILPGEYGCYRSHVRCLTSFLESDFDAALVMEDDIDVTGDLLDRTAAVLAVVPSADVVKLFNHRSYGFLGIAISDFGDEVGRCLHGPQGSAACYVITRRGAQIALPFLRVMSFPFDVALERGWHHGLNVLSVRDNVVDLMSCSRISQIGRRIDYDHVKFPGLKRLPTHLLRLTEYYRRIRYVLKV
ncbi:glycosyltransferase family 25 protein [Rhizobium sp. CNPSo 3968]|uniref:glycosyltransferase family 25 protein n=1 Tax=Rhizobium sp. CNPSo 3968 TaxID=3021408 RepID=UPI0025504BCC|nr:glycosyltransferase family 25 protein [Rhizobium sp. CNPSo 3968]MDK4718861.1 glycosyltransferase family 25 protein [Rhizobium sp. CNPSo 3968]